MYNSSVETNFRVRYSYFHKLFAENFNLGFGTPATDVCSYCEQLKNKIKQTKDADVKRTECRELNVHRVRAKQFNLLMNEEDADSTTFCFDLQQVQNLPKIPIQETYYSLQIAFYSFCIVDIKAKEPIFYTWNEVQSGRGSNEVGSAVLDFLRNHEFADNIRKIRFFSDGCGGQNKNSHMIHMLMWWLLNESPDSVNEIE